MRLQMENLGAARNYAWQRFAVAFAPQRIKYILTMDRWLPGKMKKEILPVAA